MPNLDSHMDELFQKAAENYSLKTNTGNFDGLMPFIGSETVITSVKPSVSAIKRKTALFLLAFLIMGFTISILYLNSKNNSNKTVNNIAAVNDKLISSAQNNTVAKAKVNIAPPLAAEVHTKNTRSYTTNIYQKKNLVVNTKRKLYANFATPVVDTGEYSRKRNDEPGIVKRKGNNAPDSIINQQLVRNDIVKTETRNDNFDKTEKSKELTMDETRTDATNGKRNISRNKPSLYYGMVTGIELNTVKSKEMTKAGFNEGIILGFQINKKSAIETGVLLSHKKYFSEGKYFKPKSGSMPANMTVNSLESISTLIEIPVSVKINFSKKKNSLYVKAGVSSYIMTKESNRYQAVISGQQQEVISTYKDNHNYLASDIRISGGSQHTVSKKLNIRIEPYIQIPLKGIGIGNLPLTATGLQIILQRN